MQANLNVDKLSWSSCVCLWWSASDASFRNAPAGAFWRLRHIHVKAGLPAGYSQPVTEDSRDSPGRAYDPCANSCGSPALSTTKTNWYDNHFAQDLRAVSDVFNSLLLCLSPTLTPSCLPSRRRLLTEPRSASFSVSFLSDSLYLLAFSWENQQHTCWQLCPKVCRSILFLPVLDST